MQRLEVSGAVRLIYRSLGVKGIITAQTVDTHVQQSNPLSTTEITTFKNTNAGNTKAI